MTPQLALSTTETPTAIANPFDQYFGHPKADYPFPWLYTPEEGTPSYEPAGKVTQTATDAFTWYIHPATIVAGLPSTYVDHPLAHACSTGGSASLFEDYDTIARPVVVTPRGSKAFGLPEQLRRVLDLTGMTRDEFARALGVGRRSVFNWLNGSAVSSESRKKVDDLVRLLAPALTWSDSDFRRWMRAGSPPRISLLVAGEWQEFGDLLQEGPRRRPSRTSSVAVRISGGGNQANSTVPETEIGRAELLASMRVSMRSATRIGGRRSTWVPPGLYEVEEGNAD